MKSLLTNTNSNVNHTVNWVTSSIENYISEFCNHASRAKVRNKCDCA